MRHAGLAVAAGLIAITGCGSTTSFHPADAQDIDPATGNLIALRVVYDGHPPNLYVVPGPYALVISWRRDADGVTCFLFDNVRKTLLGTRSWGVFIAGLRELPAGAEIATFTSCGGPLDYGMPEERWAEIDEVMASGGMRWRRPEEVDCTVLCTCESKAVGYPAGWGQR